MPGTELGVELRRLRELKGDARGKDVSLRDVERETGISNAYLSQLEQGQTSNPSAQNLYKLAKFYEVPYESLLVAAGYTTPGGTRSSKRPSAVGARLMSMNLTPEEARLVAYFIVTIRKGRERR